MKSWFYNLKATVYSSFTSTVLLLLSIFISYSLHSQAWEPVGTGSGVNRFIHDISVDNNGKIYIGGVFTEVSGIATKYIATWDGTSWAPMGSEFNGRVRTIARDGSGNIYVGGDFSDGNMHYFAKWNGSAWVWLNGGDNSPRSPVHAIEFDASNNVYVGGTFGRLGKYNNIIKWNVNSNSYSELGNGTNAMVRALAKDASGNLYAGGDFTAADGNVVNHIAKWNGSSWSSLGNGVNGNVRSIVVDGSGNVYAGGDFTTASGTTVNRIAKWNGSFWSSLGTGMDGAVYTLAIDDNGALYAGGNFTTAGGTTVNRIAKWDGSTWSALDKGFNNTVEDIEISERNLYAVGNFDAVGSGGTSVPGLNRIAKWELSGSSSSSTSSSSTNNALSFDGTDDFVELGNSPFYKESFTVEGWIKPQQNTKDKTGAIFHAQFNERLTAIYAEVMSNGKIRFMVRNPPSNAGGAFIISNKNVLDGNWHHFAAVKGDDDKLYLYIDGELDGTSRGSIRDFPETTGHKLLLGTNWAGSTRYFKGEMDDIRFWDRARTKEEIQANKDKTLSGNEPGLVAYYNFNQGTADGDNTGTTILNDSKGTLNGTLKNFQLTGSTSNFTVGKN